MFVFFIASLYFRNYKSLNLVLSPGIHLFYGENGQGKSNLLEAIYLLSIGKSIRATTERDLVNYFDIQNQPYGQKLKLRCTRVLSSHWV